MTNMVIAGDYKNYGVVVTFGSVELRQWFTSVKINKASVDSYELITDEHRKSAVSGIARGLVGSLLGPAGMIGGALSAKSKGKYQVAILFKDGKKSLLEVDDTTYKQIIKCVF